MALRTMNHTNYTLNLQNIHNAMIIPTMIYQHLQRKVIVITYRVQKVHLEAVKVL